MVQAGRGAWVAVRSSEVNGHHEINLKATCKHACQHKTQADLRSAIIDIAGPGHQCIAAIQAQAEGFGMCAWLIVCVTFNLSTHQGYLLSLPRRGMNSCDNAAEGFWDAHAEQ